MMRQEFLDAAGRHRRQPLEHITEVLVGLMPVYRLMHRAEVVRIDGKSYRQKEADEREAARKAERAARKTVPRSRKAAP